jgi:predicted signal transduction protein with EAL and GGDEF domain
MPDSPGERTIHISASIGIASGTLIECTSSELFRRADIAMYHAKMTGKGRVTHYDAELNSARERQLAIENQIRNGLERDEFEVWYQPIIDARSQKMSSVEALVRWPRRRRKGAWSGYLYYHCGDQRSDLQTGPVCPAPAPVRIWSLSVI